MAPSVRHLAQVTGPLELDRVRIDTEGRVQPRAEAPLRFTFTDRGHHFVCRVERTAEGARLHLCAPVTPLPYSIESGPAHARMVDLLRAARRPRRDTPVGRIVLGPRQIVCVEGELVLDGPVTPIRLIAAAAQFVAATRADVDSIMRVRAEVPAPPKRGRRR